MVNDTQAGGSDGWVEHLWPDLGIRGRLPSFLHALPFREGDRRGLFLTSDRERPQEALALTRLPSPPGLGTATEWEDEGERLASAPDWIGAVVEEPSPSEVDGTPGQQGMLWLRDRHGQELIGLLWVGRVGNDRVTVTYWCDRHASYHCGACYRRLLASLRWMPCARE